MPRNELVQALNRADAFIAGAWALSSFGQITHEVEALLDSAAQAIDQARAALAAERGAQSCE